MDVRLGYGRISNQPWHLVRLEVNNEWSGEALCGLLPTAYATWPQRWVASSMPTDGICDTCMQRLINLPENPLETRRDVVDDMLDTVFDANHPTSPDQ